MAVNNIIKRIQNIMRQDAGINGDAQRIEQMTWMFFLKVYDTQEETWEYKDENYKSIIPEDLRWRKWAVDEKDGEALTGEALLSFVNEKLFPTLKNLPIDANTPRAKSIVQETFADLNQYMKNGTLLRQVVNIVNEIEFDDADDRHTFGDIYEGILKDLQSAGNAGEFYTPRALTDFIVMMLDPKLGETFGDFTSGTGGFLISFPLMAYIIGLGVEHRDAFKGAFVTAVIVGTVVNYVVGVAMFVVVAHSTIAVGITACVLPFIPTAIIKAVLACAIGLNLRKRIPGLKA